MIEEDLFQIRHVAGYAPQIGRLVSIMRYTRFTTIEAVQGLSVANLDHRADDNSNSIGALLMHMAAVEVWYQAETFFGRELDDDEMREWKTGLDLGDVASREIRGNNLEYYLEKLARIREQTLDQLRQRDDDWLDTLSSYGRHQANNYFKWFHVTEDELSHRGQIRWLRKRLAL